MSFKSKLTTVFNTLKGKKGPKAGQSSFNAAADTGIGVGLGVLAVLSLGTAPAGAMAVLTIGVPIMAALAVSSARKASQEVKQFDRQEARKRRRTKTPRPL